LGWLTVVGINDKEINVYWSRDARKEVVSGLCERGISKVC
jgi:hypothetical protein